MCVCVCVCECVCVCVCALGPSAAASEYAHLFDVLLEAQPLFQLVRQPPLHLL